MRVGLVLQTDLFAGGAHTYEAAFQRELIEACKLIGSDLVTFSSVSHSKGANSETIKYRLTPLRMAIAHLRAQPILYKLFSLIGLGKSNLERVAERQKVDLLIFASPNHLAPGIHSIPFATTVWDFGHIDLPQASETALGGLWGWRENLYQKTLRRSTTIFCDSDATARRLESEYKVDNRRIVKIGLLQTVESVAPFSFEKPHFIYPAMFWPHKNHAMLLRAFGKFLERSGSSAYLVLTGAGQDEAKVRELANELGLQESVKFEGLVSRTKLLELVKGSSGLLMPSMLGPSNLPPLEAAFLGIPAVLSDSHSMEDLMSGGSYVDVFDEDAWAKAMSSLLRGEVSSGTLAEIDVATLLEQSLRRTRDQLQPWRAK